MLSLQKRFDIFLPRIKKIIEEFESVESELQKEQQDSKKIYGASTAFGLVILGAVTALPVPISQMITLGALTIASGMTFARMKKQSDELVSKVNLLVRDFEAEIESIEPVVDFFMKINKNNVHEIMVLKSDLKNIKRHLHNIKAIKNHKISISKFERSIDEMQLQREHIKISELMNWLFEINQLGKIAHNHGKLLNYKGFHGEIH